MIENEKQYFLTQHWLQTFQDALNQMEGRSDIDPFLKELQINALRSKINDFMTEIKQYEDSQRSV